MFKAFSKTKLLITIILLSGLFLRLYKITAAPPVISHDEVYYPVQAKSLALSGKDLSGKWQPLTFTAANELYAELPGVIMTPAALLFKNNQFLAARTTHIVLGTLLPLLLAGVVYELTKSKVYAVSTLLIAQFNPWIFQFSRMGFDSLLSLFFYFLGIYLFLKNKNWQILWSFIPFLLGFFMYQGLKIVFIPMVVILVVYKFFESKKLLSIKNILDSKPLFVFCLMALSLLTFFYIKLSSQKAGGRLSNMIFFDTDHIQAQVNLERQQAIANPYQKLFTNKVTVITREFLDNYFETFNPILLFVKGEPLRNPFSVWSTGIFYTVDALLIMYGLITLFRYKPYQGAAWFLSAFILIGPLPSAINSQGSWIMFRSSFMFMNLLMLAGIGFGSFWQLHKAEPEETSKNSIAVPFLINILQDKALFKNSKKKFSITFKINISVYAIKAVKLGFALVYLVSIVGFGYQYFYRYPFIGTKDIYFSERLFTSYTQRLPKDQKILILGSEDEFLLYEYLFYSNALNKQSLAQIRDNYNDHNFTIGNVTISTNCLDLSKLDEATTIIYHTTVMPCQGQSLDAVVPTYTQTVIPSLIDSGGVFRIINDRLCSQYDLHRFSNVNQDVFSVEELSNQDFCQNFIIREN